MGVFEQPSPARFCWLLAPSPAPPGPFCDADLADAVEFLYGCAQLLPALLPAFRSWVGEEISSRAEIRDLEARALAIRLQARLQHRWLRRLDVELSERRIAWALIKGSATRYQAYRDHEERSGRDVDIAVHPAHLAEVGSVLQALGFQAAQWDEKRRRFRVADELQRMIVEASHHELCFQVLPLRLRGLGRDEAAAIRSQLWADPNTWFEYHDGALGCYIIIDVHHGLAIDIPVNDLLDSATRVRVGTRSLPIPELGWLLFHHVAKLYWEGVHGYGQGAFQYGDVARLAPKLNREAWSTFRRLCSRYNLEAGAYYVLRRLPRELGTTLPEEIERWLLDLHRPEQFTNPVARNDLGDLWPRIWGHL